MKVSRGGEFHEPENSVRSLPAVDVDSHNTPWAAAQHRQQALRPLSSQRIAAAAQEAHGGC